MALILDHINGVADDNRLENLRIVCPNCAATLDTHCGRQQATASCARACACGATFHATMRTSATVRALRHALGSARGRPSPRRAAGGAAAVRTARRRGRGAGLVSAVGRKYGVSDNAVRKWMRAYERLNCGAVRGVMRRVGEGRAKSFVRQVSIGAKTA